MPGRNPSTLELAGTAGTFSTSVPATSEPVTDSRFKADVHDPFTHVDASPSGDRSYRESADIPDRCWYREELEPGCGNPVETCEVFNNRDLMSKEKGVDWALTILGVVDVC